MSVGNGKICDKCGSWNTLCFCEDRPPVIWTTPNVGVTIKELDALLYFMEKHPDQAAYQLEKDEI